MECFPTQMSIIPLLALPVGLKLTACSRQEGMLCVSVLSVQPTSPCPFCGTPASRIPSRDPRKLADLPSAGQPVRFLLSVRKFFCDVPSCPRKIFVERLASFVAPRARVTARLFQLVQIIGLADFRQTGCARHRSYGDPDQQTQHSPAHHGPARRVGRTSHPAWHR